MRLWANWVVELVVGWTVYLGFVKGFLFGEEGGRSIPSGYWILNLNVGYQ